MLWAHKPRRGLRSLELNWLGGADVCGLLVGGVEVPVDLDSGSAYRVEVKPCGVDRDARVVGVAHRVHGEVPVVLRPVEHVAELGGYLWEGGDRIREVGDDDVDVGRGEARSVNGDSGESADGVFGLLSAVKDVVVHCGHRRAEGMRRSADSSSSSRSRMERRPHW